MTTENNQNELPVEFELLAQLELIEQNTERTKYATRAIGQLLIYPAVGNLIGGILALVGYFVFMAKQTTPGITLIVVGALVALGYTIRGIVAAMDSFGKSR
jgi:hypothetical protein